MKIAGGASRGRRTIISVVALVIAAGVPVTLAALHNGFPVSSVKLNAKDVWVTNDQLAMAGRLNRQIDELTAGAQAASSSIDVVQDGAEVFLHDESANTIQRIERSRATLVQKTAVPPDAEIALGKQTLSILDPSNGKLWIVGIENGLSFDQDSTRPDLTLGSGAHATVGSDGHVYATSPDKHMLYTFTGPGALPTKKSMSIPADNQLSVVGDTAVILDPSGNRLTTGDGTTVKLPAGSSKIQQPGASNSYALVASVNGLLRVPLGGGSVKVTQANIPDQASPSDVSSPVFLDGCDYGAWAGSQRYVQQCGSSPAQRLTIEQQTEGDQLEFRVNKHVIALNNLQDGNTWVLSSRLVLVKNWDEVSPPKVSKTQKGHKKTTEESFEDQLAHRTDVNHPPIARPDQYGIRPGRTTILPVLDNDTDQDGDVLVITKYTKVPASFGRLDLIDGGRALQLTPAPGATAAMTESFRYTVSDGRGASADANVDLSIVPPSENRAPVELRAASVSVEIGQSISYDVLSDWTDPDGDELEVTAASPTSADSVRFTPDGYVTFQSKSGTQGSKTVNYTVSDGTTTVSKKLTVTVKGAGTLTPVGTPDFAQVFAGQTTVVQPLQNDLTPSGKPLTLVSVTGAPSSATVIPNIGKASVSVESLTPGTIYLIYKVAAGTEQGEGIIRVDVVPNPNDDLPPIAVKDVAYLRAGQSASVKVLANDVSPMGRVLSVQSVDTDSTSQSLKVELLNNTVVRLTAPTGLTKQTQFTYTISDGEHTSVAGVTVVPVAPLVNRQPPITVDDQATVRAGDIASVAVMDNDYSPDQEQLFLDPTLASTANDGGGLAFVNGSTVRYQAPTKAGQYSVVYRVADQYGESATGKVTFTVTAPNAKTNRPPEPVDQTARAFAGQTVRINVPLDGIDPDGDSVVIDGINAPPALGRIVGDGPTWFDYQALSNSEGSDKFTYDVEDAYGAIGTGTINVGVIARGDLNANPNAVNDNVEVRPGKTVSSQVLANDSDPNGFKLTLLKKLSELAPGLKAHVTGDKVIITAPKKEGQFSLKYSITNNQGGQDSAFVIVKVSKNAKPMYPSAQDDYLKTSLVHGRNPIKVNVESLINNPNGEDGALLISAEGPNSGDVTVNQAAGTVTVTPAEQRFAVAYRVTDPTNKKLTATAFIVVPPMNSSAHPQKPHLKNPLPKQVVKMNSSREWKLSDIVVDPSGKPVMLTSAENVKALNSDGSKAYINKTTIRYTPAHNFRGITAITFEVTDGSSPTDPKGIKATLTMPITVGDTNFDDVPPSFTLIKLPIQAGEKATVRDLRDATSDPNPDLIPQFTYDGLSGQTASIQANLHGSSLSVSAPLGVQPGATATLTFHIHYKSFDVPGKVIVTTVRSTRPLAQAQEDDAKGQRNVPYSMNVLANDYNPYADLNKPLRLMSAKVENAADTSATVSFTQGGDVTINPDASFIGVVSVVYTERDASNDPSRDVQGRFLLTVRDVPSQPTPPTIVDQSDKAITIGWQAPATNGEPILDYTITTSGGVGQKTVDASQAQATITGLTNGSSYTFQISARNALGDSQVSASSAAAIPFGKPGAPSGATITASSNGSGSVSMTWGAASGNGRSVSGYTWTLSDGQHGTTSGLTATATGHVGTSYKFTVVATNPAGDGDPTSSGSDIPTPGAPAGATITAGPAGNATLSLSWGAAASTEAISKYEINVNGGGWTNEGTARSTTMTGSFNTSYSFQVRAYSAGQVSGITNSNSATPTNPAPSYSADTETPTCPEQRSGSGLTNHFSSSGPSCSSAHGFVSGHLTLYCSVTVGGNNWYSFDGDGYTRGEGWYVKGTTLKNISGGIPGC